MLNSFIDNIAYFYKLDGRTSRIDFWIYLVFLVITFLCVSFIMGREFGQTFVTFMAIPLVGISVRRLNDLSKKTWYVILPTFVFLISPILKITTGHYLGFDDLSNVWLVEQIFFAFKIIAYLSILYILFLAIFRGDPDENKFGKNQDPKFFEKNQSENSIDLQRIDLPDMGHN